MAGELKKLIEDGLRTPFQSRPFYDPEDDALTFYAKDEDSYARRIDAVLTFFFSMVSHEPIGFEIKGVRDLLDRVGSFGLDLRARRVAVKKIMMGYYLLPERATGDDIQVLETFVTKDIDGDVELSPAP